MIHMDETLPEARLMLRADCPMCGEPASLDLESGALDCPACVIRLDLADEPVPPVRPVPAAA